MNHLKDKYKKDKEEVSKLLGLPVTVTLKIDGTAFQIVVTDDGEMEFHKRSGNTFKAGPIIDDYTRLFVKRYKKPIELFSKEKQYIVSKYKFLAFEVLDDNIFLLAAYDKVGNSITDISKLKAIAEKLHVLTVPILFKGKLDNYQQLALTKFCENDSVIGNSFKNYIHDIFKSYKDFPEKIWKECGDDIEGVVLDFGSGLQYKVDDPKFAEMHKQMTADAKEQGLKYKKQTDELYKALYDAINEPKKMDSNSLKSLTMNFLQINDDKLKELLNLASKIPASALEFDNDILDAKIKANIKKYGKNYATLYWKYLYMFNKPKKRNYIIDKDFQNKVNDKIKIMTENYRLSLDKFVTIYESLSE